MWAYQVYHTSYVTGAIYILLYASIPGDLLRRFIGSSRKAPYIEPRKRRRSTI